MKLITTPLTHIITVTGNDGSVDFHFTQSNRKFLEHFKMLCLLEVNKPGFSQDTQDASDNT